MLNIEQELFYKDFFVVFSALFGLVVLIFIQIKNLGIRFRPFGRRLSDYTYLNDNQDKLSAHIPIFNYNYIQKKSLYEVEIQSLYDVWYIGFFTIKKIKFELRSMHLMGLRWYEFSNSKKKTERIMLPIKRKIFVKYRDKIDTEKSLKFLTIQAQDEHLYSWLKNESQIHIIIFNFIDECLIIANELGLKLNVAVVVSDCISLEIIFPFNKDLLLFEKEIRNFYGVEMLFEKDTIKFVLWLAFSQYKIPESCLKNYEKLKIYSERRNAS